MKSNVKCRSKDNRRRLVILSVFTCLAITGCGVTAPVFKQTDELRADEGALALINHSRLDGVVFAFRKIGALGSVVESGPFSPGVQFRMVRMPVGEYEVEAVIAGNNRYVYSGPRFAIKPGVINYIGDSYVDIAPGFGTLSVNFPDTQDRFDAYLAQRFPDLAKRYPVEMTVRYRDK